MMIVLFGSKDAPFLKVMEANEPLEWPEAREGEEKEKEMYINS